MNGRMAVQCFYMISGFLISLVLSHKYDPSTADGRRLFYSNRALRIFVPYWSFCVMILAVHVVIYFALGIRRSEERRVGKAGRCGCGLYSDRSDVQR